LTFSLLFFPIVSHGKSRIFQFMSLAMVGDAYIQRLDNWMIGTDLHTKAAFLTL